MNRNLFKPDIFNEQVPSFKKSDIDISIIIEDLIKKNYSRLSYNIISVEQVQGNEINSNNYKVVTPTGVYLIKKFVDVDEPNKLQKKMLLSNWLKNDIKLTKIYLSNKNDFVVKNKNDNSYWGIFDFIDGSYFTGKSDKELISVGNEIGLFFKKLVKTPGDLCPRDKVEHFINYDCLMNEIKKSENNWHVLFGVNLSTVIKHNWDFLEKTVFLLNRNKKMILANKLTPSHIDLHPHNILVSKNSIQSILDIDSIKLDYNLVPLSFSMYKLLKQTIIIRKIRNNNNEISRITKIYFDSLINNFAPLENEKENLYVHAAAEILRRIFIIFSLNLYKKDNRWNHVLEIHLNGIKEAKIIFEGLK
jgi:hypothetical protein